MCSVDDAQEFDVGTSNSRAQKLTADLSHVEAEKWRMVRQLDSVKVDVVLLHGRCCACEQDGVETPHFSPFRAD
jgi:hypothetical protein